LDITYLLSSSLVFTPPPGQTGRRRHTVLQYCPFVRPSVCSLVSYQTYIAKTNEPILMQIGTSEPRGNGTKRSSLGIKMSNATVTKIQFGDEISQKTSDEF